MLFRPPSAAEGDLLDDLKSRLRKTRWPEAELVGDWSQGTPLKWVQGEQGERKSIAPSRKLWTALHALDGYLTGQSDWMVNYAERHVPG
jgi:hypothetical protein